MHLLISEVIPVKSKDKSGKEKTTNIQKIIFDQQEIAMPQEDGIFKFHSVQFLSTVLE